MELIIYALGLALVLVVLLVYIGVFDEVEVAEGVFPGASNFVFVGWKGNLKELSKAFDHLFSQIKEPLSQVGLSLSSQDFKNNCKIMGVYFDDPKALENPEDFRVCIGICFST